MASPYARRTLHPRLSTTWAPAQSAYYGSPSSPPGSAALGSAGSASARAAAAAASVRGPQRARDVLQHLDKPLQARRQRAAYGNRTHFLCALLLLAVALALLVVAVAFRNWPSVVALGGMAGTGPVEVALFCAGLLLVYASWHFYLYYRRPVALAAMTARQRELLGLPHEALRHGSHEHPLYFADDAAGFAAEPGSGPSPSASAAGSAAGLQTGAGNDVPAPVCALCGRLCYEGRLYVCRICSFALCEACAWLGESDAAAAAASAAAAAGMRSVVTSPEALLAQRAGPSWRASPSSAAGSGLSAVHNRSRFDSPGAVERYVRSHDASLAVGALPAAGADAADAGLAADLAGSYRVAHRRVDPKQVLKNPVLFGADNRRAARSLMAELGLAPSLEDWVLNVRRWLALVVLAPVALSLDADWVHRATVERVRKRRAEADAAAKKAGAGGFRAGGLGAAAGAAGFGAAVKPGLGAGAFGAGRGLAAGTGAGARALTDDEKADLIFDAHGVAVARLERFLRIGDAPEEYVIARTRALAASSVLGPYCWDAGGPLKGEDWSAAKQPTDAQLVMHMLATYLDAQLGAEGAFSSKFFVPLAGAARGAQAGCVQIVQAQKNPPHFRLIAKVPPSGGKRVTWEVEHGSRNLFHCVILFAHYLRTYKNGFLDHLNLAGDAVALLQAMPL